MSIAIDRLYSFAFKGILTDTALDKTERVKKSKVRDEQFRKIHETLGIDQIDENHVQMAQKMAIVYTAICAFENSVREFVSKKLLEVRGTNWWSLTVSEKVRQKAESRRTEEQKIRWHTPRGDALINYTEMGDLVSIIRSNENWPEFEPHLNTIEWVESVLKTIERSRNVIMHSGELGNADIERLGMNIRDWINQVG